MVRVELTIAGNHVPPEAVPVASAPASLTPVFTVPYTDTRLYTKLALAVKSGGQNVLIANPQYIANPELLATHTKPRQALYATRKDCAYSRI